MNNTEKFDNLVDNLSAFKKTPDLKSLKSITVNLKDFNLTGEAEHIVISFNDEDLERIKNGDLNFVAVSGRRS